MVVVFAIIAFTLFVIIKAINRLKRKEEAAAALPAKESPETKILLEIRDLLRAQR